MPYAKSSIKQLSYSTRVQKSKIYELPQEDCYDNVHRVICSLLEKLRIFSKL